MSLLSIVQAVAEEVGIAAPTLVVGNADRTAKQLLRLINRAGNVMAQKDWPILQKEYTFATVASTATYDLPSDYGHMLDNTIWDRSNYFQMRGGLDAWEWQIRKSAIATSVTSRKRFRIRAVSGVKKFALDPTPGEVANLVFEYVSSKWALNSVGDTFQTKFLADTDTTLFDEGLLELAGIWRFLKGKGLAYEEEFAEFERQQDIRFAADRVPQTLHMGGTARGDFGDIRMNLPESGFG